MFNLVRIRIKSKQVPYFIRSKINRKTSLLFFLSKSQQASLQEDFQPRIKSKKTLLLMKEAPVPMFNPCFSKKRLLEIVDK
jgi:hypothetical protein